MNSEFEQIFENSVSVLEDCDIDSVITLLPSCKGVIFFAGNDDRPILLLTAANIKLTSKTRLASCIDEENQITKRANLREITRKIYYLPCYSEFMTVWQHYKITKRIFPESYRKLLNIGAMDYVSISVKDEWPSFTITNTFKSNKDSIFFGPFISHRSANEFVKILCESLSLCRRNDLIGCPDKARTCQYLQMATCPAPCVGRISKQDYRKRIDLAIQAASGDIEPAVDFLKTLMSAHAANLNFELAHETKRKMTLLEGLCSQLYKWTTRLGDQRIVHIAESAKLKIPGSKKKTQSYDVFFIKGMSLFELPRKTMESMQEVLERIESIERNPDAGGNDPLLYNILGRFLYQSSPKGVWLNARNALPNIEQVKDLINQAYASSHQ